MSLGENIYFYRTEHHMSQGDLAEALEVSRQSVSKWENGNAVPDLERLVKMSQLFGITLDELVTGAESSAPQAPPAQPEAASAPVQAPSSSQRIWGIILTALGIACILVLSLMGGLRVGLLMTSPLLVPGIICLTAKKRVGLKCAWAEFFLISTFLMFTTGTSWMSLFAYLRNWRTFMEIGFNIIHPIVSLVQNIILLILLVWTVRSYNRETRPLSSRGKGLVAAGWVVYLLSFIPYELPIDIFSIWYRIVGELINWGKLMLLTVLLVFTWRLIKADQRKKI